jgi:hypothetical protein
MSEEKIVIIRNRMRCSECYGLFPGHLPDCPVVKEYRRKRLMRLAFIFIMGLILGTFFVLLISYTAQAAPDAGFFKIIYDDERQYYLDDRLALSYVEYYDLVSTGCSVVKTVVWSGQADVVTVWDQTTREEDEYWPKLYCEMWNPEIPNRVYVSSNRKVPINFLNFLAFIRR